MRLDHFSLSHHILVWWCVEQVHPGVLFDRYVVLGDDVVIADEAVAKVYEWSFDFLFEIPFGFALLCS